MAPAETPRWKRLSGRPPSCTTVFDSPAGVCKTDRRRSPPPLSCC